MEKNSKSSKKPKLKSTSFVRKPVGSSQNKSQVRNLSNLPKKAARPFVRSKTTSKNAHFVSLTSSQAKLDFPVKLNRKNKVIREKLRYKYLTTVKKYLGIPYK